MSGVDERTIIKIVAKINQINLERESTRKYSKNEATPAQVFFDDQISRASSYQSARRALTPIQQKWQRPFGSAEDQGLRRAVASRIPQQHDLPPTSAATLSWRPSR
eukprot:883439-Pleurochrysis_carterae.AAC.1